MNILKASVIIKSLLNCYKKNSSANEKKCPSDDKTGRTKKLNNFFSIKSGEDITEIYLKSDVILLTCAFENSKKVSIQKLGSNPLYCVSLPVYIWQY